jgi:hypothetical protein
MRYHTFVAASDKTILKMRRNQAGGRIEELVSVAQAVGLDWRRPGRGGSQVIFSASGVKEIVSVPSRRPIKPIYIKPFLALMDAASEAGNR